MDFRLIPLVFGCSIIISVSGGDDPVGHVDVFTGTSGTGHTHPAAAWPFGMIQAGPDTGAGTWEYCSGYQYADTNVLGYSQNHLSGTGCPDYGDVQILPFSGAVRKLPMSSAIAKRSERAEPGYYAVRQIQDGVSVEVTVTKRAAIYRFAWDEGREPKILVNLPFGHNCEKAGWAVCRTAAAEVRTEGNRRIVGRYFRSGWIERRPIAFALEVSRPWAALRTLSEGIPGEAPQFVLSFSKDGGRNMMLKVALSRTSSDAAERNLRAEIPEWDFNGVRAAARGSWNRMLSRLTVEGGDEAKANWYTALYHLFLQPNDWSDVGEPPFFTTLSLWDTFRAASPLYTIVAPEIVEPTVNSLLVTWKRYGRLPVMSYGGRNVDCMIGNHAVPVIADAYLKGFCGFDVGEAFVAITNTLSVAHPGKPKENWDQYLKFGYFPLDLTKSEGVSRTLECAYDDACAARFFAAIGKNEAAAEYRRRSGNWRNVFDPAVGFARGKDSTGRWREPFSPFALAHENDWPSDFTEGNAWQYTWHVMHDPDGLVAAMGGRTAFAAKLESLFRQPSRVAGMGDVSDVSGLIGQYAHGNEPSHHVIYFFPLVGRADLAAKYVRQVFDTQYHPGPTGLCGNDDCGQMSAWYLFSAMGFYPFNPCGGEYVIGAPQIPKATLNLADGKKFIVLAKNLSRKNMYVKSVTLNGKLMTGSVIKHADIVSGGTLVFEMTDSVE